MRSRSCCLAVMFFYLITAVIGMAQKPQHNLPGNLKDDLRELVQTPAIPGYEQQLATKVSARLQSYYPRIDEMSNVSVTVDQDWAEDWLDLGYAMSVHKAQGSDFLGVLLVLPAEERQLLEQFYFEGRSQKEIAERLETTPKAVSSRLERARLLLRSLLTKELSHDT